MVPAARIAQEPMRLVWRDRLIVGALNLVAGPPGAGKSSLTALIAAEVSRQGRPVILSDCEDDPASVTIPRLAVAGAILERVHVIAPEDAPVFPRDCGLLRDAVRALGAAVVVLDPIGAHFWPEHHVHKRPLLRELALAARESACAIVGVHHTTKGGEIGGPNSGLLGTSRAAYVYGFDPDDEDRRALSCAKINGCDAPPTIVLEHETVDYSAGGRLVQAGRLRSIRESNNKAGRSRGRRHPERDAACHAWLSEYLAAGDDCARRSNEVRADGTGLGYGWETIRRAKVALEVEHVRVGFGGDGHWLWRLPDEHPLRAPIDDPGGAP